MNDIDLLTEQNIALYSALEELKKENDDLKQMIDCMQESIEILELENSDLECELENLRDDLVADY